MGRSSLGLRPGSAPIAALNVSSVLGHEGTALRNVSGCLYSLGRSEVNPFPSGCRPLVYFLLCVVIHTDLLSGQ